MILFVAIIFAIIAGRMVYMWVDLTRRKRLRWGRFGKGRRLSTFSFSVWLITLLGTATLGIVNQFAEGVPGWILKAFMFGSFVLVAIGYMIDNTADEASDTK